jgi:hypothetical protein
MADAIDTLQTAVAGITALYEADDAAEILNSILHAPDQVTMLGITSALTLLTAAALREINRLAGSETAGIEWLRREALKLQGGGEAARWSRLISHRWPPDARP